MHGFFYKNTFSINLEDPFYNGLSISFIHTNFSSNNPVIFCFSINSTTEKLRNLLNPHQLVFKLEFEYRQLAPRPISINLYSLHSSSWKCESLTISDFSLIIIIIFIQN